jgi:peroxiredoxin
MRKHILLTLFVAAALMLLAGCPVKKPTDTGTPATSNAATSNTPAATANANTPGATTPPVAPPVQQPAGANAAKDFEYILFDGTTHKLSESFGKPIVVNFWADWCPPCVAELPHFEEAWKAKGTQYTMVAIAVASASKPQEFVKQQGYTMPFAIDKNGADTYGVTGIPMTLFIDRSGSIVQKVVGGMDKETFEANLAKIL